MLFRPRMVVSAIFSLLVCCGVALAQEQYQDVLYLKNGSIIRGVVIELVPNETIKIKIDNGSIFVFKMSEVEKIEKVAVKRKQQEPSISTLQQTIKLENRKQLDLTLLGVTYVVTLAADAAIGEDEIGATVIPVVGALFKYLALTSDPTYEATSTDSLLILSTLVQTYFLVDYLQTDAELEQMNKKISMVLLLPHDGGIRATFLMSF